MRGRNCGCCSHRAIAIILVVDHTFSQPRSQDPGNEVDCLQCQLKEVCIRLLDMERKDFCSALYINVSTFKLNASLPLHCVTLSLPLHCVTLRKF